MRVLRTSLALVTLGLLMSSLSGCVAQAVHAVVAPAMNSAFENIHEANATPESMGVSTAQYRGMDCASLTRTAEAYRQDQYNPQHTPLTSRYMGWQIDAINQVRAEKACDGDAAAQAAAPKVQMYGFCFYSPVGSGDDPDDYDTYITPNFPYLVDDYTATGLAQAEFTDYLKSTRGMRAPNGICMAEDNLAKLEPLRERVSAEGDSILGNDDIQIAWQPSERPAAMQAPTQAAPPAAALPPVAAVAGAAIAPSAPVPATSGRGWLGVYPGSLTPILTRELGLQSMQGALVLGVSKDGAGARAGLRALDVIQSLDSQPIISDQQFLQLLAAKTAGTTVTLQVWRGHRQENVSAVLSATPTPSQVEPGPGYCYAVVPVDGYDQINWVSSPFPVPDTTTAGLQARGKIVGEQFRNYLLGLGMANQVGQKSGYGICNAGLGNVEHSHNGMLSLADSAAHREGRIELVPLIWQP
jgi:membrane-associated protease RseP (regulator of RpoE activity)